MCFCCYVINCLLFSLGFLDTLSANSVIVAKLIKSSVSRKESNWNEIKAVTIFFPTLFSSGLIKLLVVVVIVSVNFIWVINWNRSNIGWPNYVLIYLSWATHTHTILKTSEFRILFYSFQCAVTGYGYCFEATQLISYSRFAVVVFALFSVDILWKPNRNPLMVERGK